MIYETPQQVWSQQIMSINPPHFFFYFFFFFFDTVLAHNIDYKAPVRDLKKERERKRSLNTLNTRREREETTKETHSTTSQQLSTKHRIPVYQRFQR